MKAIGIIHDEHRSLAAVLHGMLYLVRDIREHGSAPNFDLLSAMVYYIDAFPERYHHPKEDGYLFRLLRKRHPAAAPVLDQLERQHKEGAAKIRDLEQGRQLREAPPDREWDGLFVLIAEIVLDLGPGVLQDRADLDLALHAGESGVLSEWAR